MKRLLILFSLFLAFNCQSQSATTDSKFKTIMLRASGEVETLPDRASFNINLSCLNKSIESAKSCLVEKSNALMKTLQSFGIDKDDILTTSVTLNKSYTWTNNTKVFEGYKSATSVYVTVKDLDKLDAIYTQLLGNENLDLGGLNFTHSKMDNLKNDAYVDALKKADQLADRLLENLSESKKEVLKIGNVMITASTPKQKLAVADMAYERDSDTQPIAISKGTIKVTATLYVEYQIE